MTPQIAAGGTCYFKSYGWAVVYYMQYQPKDTEGYRVACRREVKRKIEEGEIKIGAPPVIPGTIQSVIQGRYHYSVDRSQPIDQAPCFDCGQSVEWNADAKQWQHVGENGGCFMDHRNKTQGGA